MGNEKKSPEEQKEAIKKLYKKLGKPCEVQSSYLRGRHREYVVPTRRREGRKYGRGTVDSSRSRSRSRSRSPIARRYRGCMSKGEHWDTIPSPPHKSKSKKSGLVYKPKFTFKSLDPSFRSAATMVVPHKKKKAVALAGPCHEQLKALSLTNH